MTRKPAKPMAVAALLLLLAGCGDAEMHCCGACYRKGFDAGVLHEKARSDKAEAETMRFVSDTLRQRGEEHEERVQRLKARHERELKTAEAWGAVLEWQRAQSRPVESPR